MCGRRRSIYYLPNNNLHIFVAFTLGMNPLLLDANQMEPLFAAIFDDYENGYEAMIEKAYVDARQHCILNNVFRKITPPTVEALVVLEEDNSIAKSTVRSLAKAMFIATLTAGCCSKPDAGKTFFLPFLYRRATPGRATTGETTTATTSDDGGAMLVEGDLVESDIHLVQEHASVTRAEAVQALLKKQGDIVDAISFLSIFSHNRV